MSVFTVHMSIEAPSMSAALQEVHKALYVADVEAQVVTIEEAVRFTELDLENYDEATSLKGLQRLFEDDIDPA